MAALQKYVIELLSTAAANEWDSGPGHATFLFLDLPAELRNLIYTFVFDYEVKASSDHERCPSNALALLRLNHQVYEEACLLPYLCCTFVFFTFGGIERFAKLRTPQQLRSMQRVQLSMICISSGIWIKGLWPIAELVTLLQQITSVKYVALRCRGYSLDNSAIMALELLAKELFKSLPKVKISAENVIDGWTVSLDGEEKGWSMLRAKLASAW